MDFPSTDWWLFLYGEPSDWQSSHLYGYQDILEINHDSIIVACDMNPVVCGISNARQCFVDGLYAPAGGMECASRNETLPPLASGVYLMTISLPRW